MNNIPASIISSIEDGQKQLAEQRCQRAEELRRQEKERAKDEKYRIKKSWSYLCVEAKVDLELVDNYVNWKMPAAWKPQQIQWLFIVVPGLTNIIAEYECNVFEWRLRQWAVAYYSSNGNKIFKSWVAFDKSQFGLPYVMAVAAEQKLKLTELESNLSNSDIDLSYTSMQIASQLTNVPKIAEIFIEEI